LAWNTDFPKLPHRGSTQNQYRKRNRHPPGNCPPHNSHKPFFRPTNLQHFWVALSPIGELQEHIGGKQIFVYG